MCVWLSFVRFTKMLALLTYFVITYRRGSEKNCLFFAPRFLPFCLVLFFCLFFFLFFIGSCLLFFIYLTCIFPPPGDTSVSYLCPNFLILFFFVKYPTDM